MDVFYFLILPCMAFLSAVGLFYYLVRWIQYKKGSENGVQWWNINGAKPTIKIIALFAVVVIAYTIYFFLRLSNVI